MKKRLPGKKAQLEKSPTGVQGLDAIMRGGWPSHRLYLVKGNPGVGKTTLALQYLMEGTARGEKALYITLSETQDEITAVAESHGWDISQIAIFELSALEQQLAHESQNTVFHPSEVELNQTTNLLLKRIDEVKPARLVIDSLSELRLLSDTALRYRRQMLALKQFFAGRNMTVLLLDDHAGEGGDLHVQSIAHGVVTIEQLESDYGAERRRVKVNKLRGVDFVGGFHDAIIEPGGLRVFPRLVAAEHHIDFDDALLESGLPNLDALVSGGLDRGTSCLLLGPAGTGKSSIAMQFAVAAAQRGENVELYLFEEQFRTLMRRAQSLGMPLAELKESGRITFTQVDPAELAPGQFVNLVTDAVERRKTRLIVIDSLNGYLQAMPDVKFLNIQLHELLSFLAHHGVVTLMTVAQHGILGHMNSPVDLTYLADTVILLRYFEESGRIRKAISVVKKRIGAHEDTIRELKLEKGGIRVGEALHNFHGVLTGVPRYKGPSDRMMSKD
jgi:circadian clock protein KaiC